MRLLPKLKIIRKRDFGWVHRSVLNSFISVLLLIHLKRNTWVRDKISFPFHVSPIYLPWHNKFLKPEWRVLSCFPLFFPLSQLSLVYFLVFALIVTVSQDIIKLEWVASHPWSLPTDVSGPRSQSHGSGALACLERKRNLDTPQLEPMAKLQITFYI